MPPITGDTLIPISLVLTIVGATFSIAKVYARVGENSRMILGVDERLRKHEQSDEEKARRIIVLETKFANVEAMLAEIKADLKEIKAKMK